MYNKSNEKFIIMQAKLEATKQETKNNKQGSDEKDSTKQPNLYNYYFTPFPHLLLNITSSSNLPLT